MSLINCLSEIYLSNVTEAQDCAMSTPPSVSSPRSILMMDRDTGRPRGFGFITMNTPEEAQAAIGALNGKSIDGRALTVNVARPREERPPGGGGRREYGGGGGRGRH